MDEKPIVTRPINENEKLLRMKFYESITKQSDLMDEISKQLITVELSIPGLYAIILKLMRGEAAIVNIRTEFYFAFICWSIALLFTFIAITPKNWIIDPELYKQDPKKTNETLGIEDFFMKSAQYKRKYVIASSILFFLGVFFASFTLG